MHKGYAFVQFANPFDARSACLGEDGKTIKSQTIGKKLREIIVYLRTNFRCEYGK